jgi:hypothetical protein
VHVGTTYAPPAAEHSLYYAENRDAALHGVTTFLWKCSDPECSYTKKVECLGKVTEHEA